MRTIKKYSNGRMYDTVLKDYISRKRIVELLKEGEQLVVVESKTGKDITDQFLPEISHQETSPKQKNGAKDSPEPEKGLNYLKGFTHWMGERIDESVKSILHRMDLPTKSEINQLTTKIESLTRKIEEMESSLKN